MNRLSIGEKLAYYGANIMTFGLWWILKIVIKKAILESK